MRYGTLGINSNQLLGLTTTYKRSAAYMYNRQFTLGHFVALGPLTFPNLNISTIWVRYPWVSIQINFWVSLPPTKQVLHTCKLVNYF